MPAPVRQAPQPSISGTGTPETRSQSCKFGRRQRTVFPALSAGLSQHDSAAAATDNAADSAAHDYPAAGRAEGLH